MHWLGSNYQWIVAIVVMPILLLLLKQWADSRKKAPTPAPAPQTALNAQQSQVTNSPVAAGSGINQNVNAPVINVNVGQPSAAPKQVVSPKTEHPIPNIVYAGGRRKRVFVSPSQREGICDPRTEDERTKSVEAFVLKFENKVIGGRKIGRALNVISKMKFRHKNGATEREIDYGVWLNSPCNSTDMGIGDTRELVLMCVVNDKLLTLEDRRIDNRFLDAEGFAYIESSDVDDYDRVDITIIDQNSQASLHTKLKVWREGASFFSSEL